MSNTNILTVLAPIQILIFGICNKFSAQYLEILKDLNIRAYEKKSNIDPFTNTYHSDVIFLDDNGVEHKVSLANDLSRIQSHSKTKYFSAETLSDEDLSKIDTTIGYISKKNPYIDAHLEICSKLIDRYNVSESDKLELLFHFLPRFYDVKKIGDDEQFKVLKFLNKRVLHSQNNSIYRSYNRESRTEDYYFKCFTPPQDGNPPKTDYFLFNKETRSYEKISYKDLEKTKLLEGTQLYC